MFIYGFLPFLPIKGDKFMKEFNDYFVPKRQPVVFPESVVFPDDSNKIDLSYLASEEIKSQMKNLDFEKTVYLGTLLGRFREFLLNYSSDVDNWKNYYDNDDVLKGEAIHLLEKKYASHTLDDITEEFCNLFENYLYPQVNE
jgi:hypothetical protein